MKNFYTTIKRIMSLQGVRIAVCLSVLLPLTPYPLPLLSAAGVTSSEFLLIGVGARPQAVGNAYTALSDDINSIYWNQAGLGLMTRPEMSFMHSLWLDNIGYSYAAFGMPTKYATVAVSVHYLSVSDIAGRENQLSVPVNFGASDSMINLGLGKRITNDLAAGISVKYIRSQIENTAAETNTFDIGLLYSLPALPLRAGVAVRNLGGSMRFIDVAEKLPLNIGCGAGYRIGGLTLAMDVRRYVHDNVTEFSFGTEFMPVSVLTLRGGTLLSRQNISGFMPSGGIGLRVGKGQLDYAFTPFGGLGTSHKVSLSSKF